MIERSPVLSIMIYTGVKNICSGTAVNGIDNIWIN